MLCAWFAGEEAVRKAELLTWRGSFQPASSTLTQPIPENFLKPSFPCVGNIEAVHACFEEHPQTRVPLRRKEEEELKGLSPEAVPHTGAAAPPDSLTYLLCTISLCLCLLHNSYLCCPVYFVWCAHVHACMHVCTHACMAVYMQAYIWKCVWKPEISVRHLSYRFLSLGFKTGSCTGLALAAKLTWLACKTRVFSCLCLLVLGLQA